MLGSVARALYVVGISLFAYQIPAPVGVGVL